MRGSAVRNADARACAPTAVSASATTVMNGVAGSASAVTDGCWSPTPDCPAARATPGSVSMSCA